MQMNWMEGGMLGGLCYVAAKKIHENCQNKELYDILGQIRNCI